MSVAKVMANLSFTTVVQLYNGTKKSQLYDGTTERSFGFRWSFNAVAPFHGPSSNLVINEQATVSPSMHRLPHSGPGSPKM